MSESHDLKDYEHLALGLLRRELGAFVEKIIVREDVDYDDEPALFFDAWMDENAPLDLGVDFMNAHLELKKALETKKELRFPYLTVRHKKTDYPENFVLKPLSLDRMKRERKRA